MKKSWEDRSKYKPKKDEGTPAWRRKLNKEKGRGR